MTNLDRLLEKSMELREMAEEEGPNINTVHCEMEHRRFSAETAEFKDQIISIAVEALEKMISISMPLYEGEDIFYPALQALRKIEDLAAKALGESKS